MPEIENYKPNSHRSKQTEKSETPPEKKIEKIVKGEAKREKKTALQKIAGAFVGGDVDDIGNYIFMEVIVPAVKDTISRTVSNAVDLFLYGETSKSERKRSERRAYDKVYDERNRSQRSSRRRGTYEYDDIIIPTRDEADHVLEVMDDYIDRYKQVTVADLYDMVGITDDNFANNNYGWTDIRNAQVIRVRDGYKLKLPRALQLD